jgi:hypothetical protein
MREIKFRAWHCEAKEYCKGSTSNMFSWIDDGQPITLEQFTGLQDNSGFDIYEGDILQYLDEYDDEPSIHFVQYSGDQGYPAFELSPDLGFECNGFAGVFQGSSGELKVIGNIHENKGLL